MSESSFCGLKINSNIIVAQEFRLYMDFDILTSPSSASEIYCVEMVDNVCTRPYMQFDLICIHFPHMTNLKMNSESIGGVVFPDTCTHLLLN